MTGLDEEWGWQGWAGTNELLCGKAAWDKTCNAGRQNIHGEQSQDKVSSETVCPPCVVSPRSAIEPGAAGTFPKGEKKGVTEVEGEEVGVTE